MSFFSSVAGGVAGLVGAGISAIGGSKANAHREAGARMLQQLMEEYGLMDMPNFDEFRDRVNALAAEGIIDPYTELSIMQKDSEGRARVGDPAYLDAQKATIDYFNEVVSQEGMTAQDKAAYFEIADQIEQTVRSSEQAVLANMQQRGVAGGGAELAAKLQASQSAGVRASRAGVDLLALNEKRRDAANAARGEFGMQARNQAFNEALQGDQMLMNASRQNFDMGMSAANADAQSRQREFDNELGRLQGKTGAVSGYVGQKNLIAQGTADLWAGIGQAVNTLGQVPGAADSGAPDAAAAKPAAATKGVA